MAALGWLLNLGFAGGGAAVIVPGAEFAVGRERSRYDRGANRSHYARGQDRSQFAMPDDRPFFATGRDRPHYERWEEHEG
jgi:hypothetical protein